MNRGIAYILLAVSAVACGKPHTLEVGQFAPYVQQFEAKSVDVGAPVRVEDLKIAFGPMQNELENGACEIVGDGTPTITVNQKAWNRMTEVDRQALLFHEMGHCVLRRNHVKQVDERGVPVSLMNPYRIHAEIIEENEDYYFHELFSHRGDF